MTRLFRLFSVLPLWLSHALGGALGWLVFGLSPTYRRRTIENARQAGYRFADIAGCVAHAGRMTAELPRLWLGAPPAIHWEDTAAMDAAYAAGRGVVFLTPHMGCFEICAQAVGARHAERHGPLTVLYRPARQAWLADLMRTARNRPGLQAVPTTLAGVRQMIKALRAGRAVGLLPDQVPPDGQGLWAPFFGKPAYTMTLAARLALQTGASVLLIWAERLAFGRGFRVHVRALLQPLAGTLDEAVAQINREMERLIRECPQQYLWGYGRYKAPRQESP
jgi:Kdo2-lipid IVA lauroyltransferase/acyltransferase